MSASMDDAGLELGLPGQVRFTAAKGRTPMPQLGSPPLRLRTMYDRDEPAPEAVPSDQPTNTDQPQEVKSHA